MTEDEKRVAKDLADSFAAAMDAEASDEAPLVCGLENPEVCESCQ
jgi:hypothetical protein